MQEYDIIIIGAGPAGLALADKLLESNLKILILDKKKNAEDIQYHCGFSSLNLKEWDLPENISHSLNKFYISSKNNTSVRQGFTKLSINRKKLLKFLDERVRKNKNITIKYNISIKNINFSKDKINYLGFSQNKKQFEVSARLFADCSGLGSILGTKLGLSPALPRIALGVEYLVHIKKEPHSVEMFLGRDLSEGYGWILPISNDIAIVGYGTFSRRDFPNIESRLKDMWRIKRVTERCCSKPIEKRFAVLRTGHPLKKFSKNNLVIIGDSALQVNPLIGEGIKFVMDAAQIAAPAIIKSLHKNNFKFLKKYDKNWKKKYYRKYKTGFFIQNQGRHITQNDNLTDFFVKRLKYVSDKLFLDFLAGNFSYINLFRYSPKLVFKLLFKK